MLEKFHFEHGGKKFDLPLLSNLKFGLIRKLRKASQEEQMFMIIEEVSDKRALAAIDDMTSEEVGKLMTEWQKASGVDMGESEGSAES